MAELYVRVVADAEPIEASSEHAADMADQVADAIGAPRSAVLPLYFQPHPFGRGGILTVSIEVPAVIE